jgi:hypothetical protein
MARGSRRGRVGRDVGRPHFSFEAFWGRILILQRPHPPNISLHDAYRQLRQRWRQRSRSSLRSSDTSSWHDYLAICRSDPVSSDFALRNGSRRTDYDASSDRRYSRRSRCIPSMHQLNLTAGQKTQIQIAIQRLRRVFWSRPCLCNSFTFVALNCVDSPRI